MDILIIANYCGAMDGKGNSRFQYLATLLCEKHDVEIITSDFNHILKKPHASQKVSYDYKITRLHEPGYRKNVSVRRLYSHYIWGKNIKKYLERRKKPDVIYCAVPSLTGPYLAAKFSEKNSVKYIIDVQDLWPEAFQMVFNIPILSRLIFWPLTHLANTIYRKADEVVAVSQTYVDRAMAVNRKCKSGHAVFLGTDLDTFDKNVRENKVEKKEEELWLAYCGTLGSSYDITCVIDALTILKERNIRPPKFIVMGDGPRRAEFEKNAREKQVDVWFTGRLPYAEMCGLLSACDIAVNPITHGAAQSIINKHADYAAAGLPVINTQECREYRKLVNQYQMGFNCENSDGVELADCIEIMGKNKSIREQMEENARRCAEERFDRKSTYQVIINILVDNGR